MTIVKVGPLQTAAGYAKPTLRVYGSVVELTKGTGGTKIDGNATPTQNNPSDPVLKENVVKIGEHQAGFGLYLFDYKAEYRDRLGSERQFGVMADEVQKVMPEAVSQSEFGYRQVNYAKIGVVRSFH